MGKTRIDMRGQRYGKLVGIRRVKNQGRRTRWLFKCDCGKVIEKDAYNARRHMTRSCGCLQSEVTRKKMGELNPQWKGGRRLLADGYVMVWSPFHPYACRNVVLEHRRVMERTLGRFLLPDEFVHHKNGIKDDNRPDNLELWSKIHPQGKRIRDLVVFAMEVLNRYAPDRLRSVRVNV